MPLRVVAGSAGGLLLQTPKRHPLRPTQDRIRQVIFSSLAARVPGARVLDLYAGTGALGIEALSRGAAFACFVEEAPAAAACIRENLRHCRLEGEVAVLDVARFLARPSAAVEAARYDLILADPPYVKTPGSLETEPLLSQLVPWITPGGCFVWEHFAGRKIGPLPGNWSVLRQRTYGETGLTFFQFNA